MWDGRAETVLEVQLLALTRFPGEIGDPALDRLADRGLELAVGVALEVRCRVGEEFEE